MADLTELKRGTNITIDNIQYEIILIMTFSNPDYVILTLENLQTSEIEIKTYFTHNEPTINIVPETMEYLLK